MNERFARVSTHLIGALVVFGLTACVASVPALVAQPATGTAAPAPVDSVLRFARQVSPFVLTDAQRRIVAQPFLGGFDVPRPQLLDIDGDGDLDLFVQERSNGVMHFENVNGTFTWRTDRFLDLPVGEWYRFVDLDADGLPDLLTESPVSYIRAWRNVGTRAAPRFTIAVDSLQDSNGEPIAADRQNILNIVDIDCNGRLDLFLGRVSGSVDRYEAVPGTERNGVPRFTLHTERFEDIEVLGPVPGGVPPLERGSMRHGANTLAFSDIDGDGDLDLFWGDYFEAGVLLIENRSTGCTIPNMRGKPAPFPEAAPVLTSGYNAPALGDVTGNGLQDLVLGVIGGAYSPRTTSVENLLLVAQTSRGKFEVTTRRLIPTIDVGSEAMPTLADLDGDGDLDLLVGNKISPNTDTTGTITWFENTGTRTAPAFAERGPLAMQSEFHYAPWVADLDGDGLPDLVLGTWRDRVQWWRNVGSRGEPKFAIADTALITLTRGSNTTPTLADLDGDGDLDMLVGEASGQINLYTNVGSRTAPRFELVSDTYLDIDVGRRSAPVLADLRGDGKPDLLIGSEDGGVQRWRNVSDASGIRFEPAAALDIKSGTFSTIATGDVDGDGDLDVIIGTASGGLLYFENVRGALQPASRR
jgi:hypothetical protein